MTTFAELQAAVYIETNRPDAIAQTQNAIISATQFLHSMDFFYQDIQEGLFIFDTPAYLQIINTGDLLNFRQTHVIRKWDPLFAQSQANPTLLPPLPYTNFGYGVNDNIALRELDCITAADIFDRFKSERVDVYYQVGSTIKIKSSTAVPQAILQWFAFPVTGTAGANYTDYSSWIADQYKFAVVYVAASNCFGQFGDQDTANRYFNQMSDGSFKGMAATHIKNIILNNTVAKGW